MPDLSPDLCRAARALLRLTQPQLARLAGLGERTVKAYEAGRPVAAESVAAIDAALNAQRIVLVSDPDGTVGVLQRPPDGPA